ASCLVGSADDSVRRTAKRRDDARLVDLPAAPRHQWRARHAEQHHPRVVRQSRRADRVVRPGTAPAPCRKQPAARSPGTGRNRKGIMITFVILNWRRQANVHAILAALDGIDAITERSVWNYNPRMPYPN